MPAPATSAPDRGAGATPLPPIATGPAELRFVTSVAPDGRYFLDQNGEPVLLKGDSPWSALARASVEQWEAYCASREALGTNAVILDLVVMPDGGRGNDRAATFDGLEPFEDFSDWTTPDEAYWERVDTFVETAAAHGISVILFPAYASGGTGAISEIGAQPAENWEAYGRFLGERYKDRPNVLWAMGGDFFPEAWDQFTEVYRGIQDGVRSAGDEHLWTAHLTSSTSSDPSEPGFRGGSSFDNPGLRSRYDIEFVYTYQPPYPTVQGAVRARRRSRHLRRGQLRRREQQRRPGHDVQDPAPPGRLVLHQRRGGRPHRDERLVVPGRVGRPPRPPGAAGARGLPPGARVARLVDAGARRRRRGADRGRRHRPGHGQLRRRWRGPPGVRLRDRRGRGGPLARPRLPPTPRTVAVDVSAFADDATARWIDPSSGFSYVADLTDLTPPGEGDWLLVIEASPR